MDTLARLGWVWDGTVNDPRGTIESICRREINDVLQIFSVKGAVRSNHYHKTDWHICYVVRGHVEWFERPADSDETPVRTVLRQGDYIYTKPMIEHTSVFLENTVLLAFCGCVREKENYEEDIVRCQDLSVVYRYPDLAKGRV